LAKQRLNHGHVLATSQSIDVERQEPNDDVSILIWNHGIGQALTKHGPREGQTPWRDLSRRGFSVSFADFFVHFLRQVG
jgi:anti-sigma regulatory factor (Ser/Thr protein kinase)